MEEYDDLLLDSKILRSVIYQVLNDNAMGLYNACKAAPEMNVKSGPYYRLKDWLYPDKAEGKFPRPLHSDIIKLCDTLGISFKIQVEITEIPDHTLEFVDPRYKEEVERIRGKTERVKKITEDYIGEAGEDE